MGHISAKVPILLFLRKNELLHLHCKSSPLFFLTNVAMFSYNHFKYNILLTNSVASIGQPVHDRSLGSFDIANEH